MDGMSLREAARTFGLHRDTVRKMLAYSVPPGYLPSAESAPKAQAVALHLRGALNGPHPRPGLLLSGGGMEEVPYHDPSAGRASGTPDCFTLPLAANRRETPLFRQLTEPLAPRPCQWVAEKVSLVPLACSVSEGADYSRPSLQVNGTRPRLCTTNRSYNKFIVHSPLILTPAPDPNKLGGIGIPSP